MNGYSTNIERDTLGEEKARQVLFTGPHLQLVLMTLQPGAEIGLESHEGHDQFIRVEAGTGTATLDGEEVMLEDGSVVIIPSGVEHNVVNTSSEDKLKLYTLYGPPEHPEGTVHKIKTDEG